MIDFNNFWFQSYKDGALMNAKEVEDSYILQFRAVGLDKKDIQVNFDDDVLVVKSLNDRKKESDTSWLRHEFWQDTLNKRIIIPENADKDQTQAKVENGILTVEIKKKEKSQRAIEVL